MHLISGIAWFDIDSISCLYSLFLDSVAFSSLHASVHVIRQLSNKLIYMFQIIYQNVYKDRSVCLLCLQLYKPEHQSHTLETVNLYAVSVL